LDKVPEIDLKEAGTLVLLVDGVKWLGKMHALRLLNMEDMTVTDDMIQSKVNEIRTKNPLLANILDRIHHMNLKETFTVACFGCTRAHIESSSSTGNQRRGFVVYG
jgi:hypothetical protein